MNCQKEIEKYQKEILKLKTDQLTGIGNRFKLNDYLEDMNREKTYKVILIDVDNLHNVNREKGYLEGDKYLLDIVNNIKEKLTNTSAVFFRIGGDEFLIFHYLYDTVDLSKIKNITYTSFVWYPEKLTFRNLMEELDKNLIKLKNKNKSFMRKILEKLCICR
jgi:GGDEF domain-containing protein